MKLTNWFYSLVAVFLLSIVGCGGGGGGGGGGGSAPPPAVDTIAPTVAISSPVANALTSGTVIVTVTASDNLGVTKVELYEGTNLKGTLTTAPYSFNWNTTTLTNGSTYSLTAKAYDAAGHVTTSSAVPVQLREIRLRTSGSATDISGIQIDITIPAGATLAPVPIPNTVPAEFSYVTVTGVAAAAGAIESSNFTSQTLTASIATGTPFNIGDFMTINCTFAPGSSVPLASFAILAFNALNSSGVGIPGVIAEVY